VKNGAPYAAACVGESLTTSAAASARPGGVSQAPAAFGPTVFTCAPGPIHPASITGVSERVARMTIPTPWLTL